MVLKAGWCFCVWEQKLPCFFKTWITDYYSCFYDMLCRKSKIYIIFTRTVFWSERGFIQCSIEKQFHRLLTLCTNIGSIERACLLYNITEITVGVAGDHNIHVAPFYPDSSSPCDASLVHRCFVRKYTNGHKTERASSVIHLKYGHVRKLIISIIRWQRWEVKD